MGNDTIDSHGCVRFTDPDESRKLQRVGLRIKLVLCTLWYRSFYLLIFAVVLYISIIRRWTDRHSVRLWKPGTVFYNLTLNYSESLLLTQDFTDIKAHIVGLFLADRRFLKTVRLEDMAEKFITIIWVDIDHYWLAFSYKYKIQPNW